MYILTFLREGESSNYGRFLKTKFSSLLHIHSFSHPAALPPQDLAIENASLKAALAQLQQLQGGPSGAPKSVDKDLIANREGLTQQAHLNLDLGLKTVQDLDVSVIGSSQQQAIAQDKRQQTSSPTYAAHSCGSG